MYELNPKITVSGIFNAIRQRNKILNITIECNHESKKFGISYVYRVAYEGNIVDGTTVAIREDYKTKGRMKKIDIGDIDHIVIAHIDLLLNVDLKAEDPNDGISDSGYVNVTIVLDGVRKKNDLSFKRALNSTERVSYCYGHSLYKI